MSQIYGADVAELRRLSHEFRQAADELDQAGGRLSGMLNGVDWIGAVAGRFTNQWFGVQIPRLGVSTNFLREAADTLSRNADQQERASQAGPSLSVQPIPPPPRLRVDTGPISPGDQYRWPIQGGTWPIQGPREGAVPGPETSGPLPPFSNPDFAFPIEDEASLRHRFVEAWGPKRGSPFDEWNFRYNPSGNCTSFVAWRLNDIARELGLDWSMDNNHVGDRTLPRLGNAHEWGANAGAIGIPVDTTPAPGAVAWWGVGDGQGPHGHVGVVREVQPDGTIVVEESSWGSDVFSIKEYRPDDPRYPGGFLHLLPSGAS